MRKLTSIALVTFLLVAGNAAANIDYNYVKTPVGPELGSVMGIAIDANGVIYVVQYHEHNVLKIAVDGTLSRIGHLHPGDTRPGGALHVPKAVAVDPAGNIFVTQHLPTGAHHALAMFPSDGLIQRLWSHTNDPFGVAVGLGGDPISSLKRNAIYVTGPHAVYRIRPDQAGLETDECRKGVSYGYCRPQQFGPSFGSPQGVAVDSIGQVWVSDTHHNQVKRLFADGTLARTYPGFKHPTSITTDLGGHAYVADLDHDTVKIIDRSSDLIVELGSEWFHRPNSVAVEPNCATRCSVYVSEPHTRRIWKLTPTP